MIKKQGALRIVKGDETYFDREALRMQILRDYQKSEKYSTVLIDRLEESMTESEALCSADTIATMRFRALLNEGKYLAAHRVLTHALIADPQNIPLRLEYPHFTSTLTSKVISMGIEDRSNPIIEVLAEILKSEGSLGIKDHFFYISHLVEVGKFKKAERELIPFIQLYPACVGLDELVLKCNAVVNNPIFQNHLERPKPKINFSIYTVSRSPQQILALTKKYSELARQLEDPEKTNLVSEELNKIIGNADSIKKYDLALKDFYYLKAVVDNTRGFEMSATIQLLTLVQLDPANIFYQSLLDRATGELVGKTMNEIKTNSFEGNILEFFKFIRSISVPNLDLIKHTALFHCKQGRPEEAKGLISLLVSRSPNDKDYLIAAFQIAVMTKDENWLNDLSNHIRTILNRKPYHLELEALLYPEQQVIN